MATFNDQAKRLPQNSAIVQRSRLLLRKSADFDLPEPEIQVENERKINFTWSLNERKFVVSLETFPAPIHTVSFFRYNDKTYIAGVEEIIRTIASSIKNGT